MHGDVEVKKPVQNEPKVDLQTRWQRIVTDLKVGRFAKEFLKRTTLRGVTSDDIVVLGIEAEHSEFFDFEMTAKISAALTELWRKPYTVAHVVVSAKETPKPPVRNGLRDLPAVEAQPELPGVEVIAPEHEIVTSDASFEIELYSKIIGDDEVNAVNARELHAKLEVGRDFSNWIKDRIGKYDFIENSDFIVAKNGDGENKGFQPIEYFISLDMAKELSMVESNYQGKIARRYFIECEKKMRGVMIEKQPKPTKPTISIRELNEQFKDARELAFNRGFQNGQANDAAVRLLKETTGVDLDAIIGVPKVKMDINKLSQRDLLA